MDLYCPTCGEPWDNDSLHERVAELDDGKTTYDIVAADFRTRGCVALGGRHGDHVSEDRAEAASVLYELLGDDMDGAAAMLDDLGL